MSFFQKRFSLVSICHFDWLNHFDSKWLNDCLKLTFHPDSFYSDMMISGLISISLAIESVTTHDKKRGHSRDRANEINLSI